MREQSQEMEEVRREDRAERQQDENRLEEWER